MIAIEWKHSYSVGIAEFDEHHRHLFDLLNIVYDACMMSNQKAIFCDAVAKLAEYTSYHFTAEEQLMEQFCYPGLAVQREEHALFARKIDELIKAQTLGKDECTIDLVELTQFLMDWLTHHILEVDKQYSHLLIDKVPIY
jgi:hemerythrin-like metal-binding protein